ncbi:trihelix transcription factor GT-2-like [Vitis riparia]|uniref:trihelix transcription factor GT-2-like n=1 Tax=Vitis riparia TaxID=96939 RepID=UPI00155B1414|nr:trihelix transcription factor GT-2-like [Vitis riparia]
MVGHQPGELGLHQPVTASPFHAEINAMNMLLGVGCLKDSLIGDEVWEFQLWWRRGGGGGGDVGDVGDVGGGGGSNSGGYGEEDRGRGEEGDRGSAGNRWPRQETLALLKIRSDMDVTFRDSSLKGPLWEEVSRKLAELGYHRSAKKCKEKFENVFKYHRRTKEGRASKADGKTYRFFEQLEALETQPSLASLPHSKPPAPAVLAATMPLANLPTTLPQITVPSTLPNPTNSTANPTIPTIPSPTPPTSRHPPHNNVHTAHPAMAANFLSNSTSSSTSSDEELERRGKRKRKWKAFFQRLMKDVIERQEELQKRFLEAIEKREHDRMVREEAWKMQEMARMNREHELLVQERSIAAAKDAAVIAFLQKISEQQNPVQLQDSTPPLPQPQAGPPQPPPPQPQLQLVKVLEPRKMDNGGGGENLVPTSSSRWPKAEVQALIRLRTSLDVKYQENGPKGPLWEEISAGMRKLGYNRNAKRCKEKWENINKYFKKVKESNKKRPEDSKTCPYFHQLEALYKEKNKMEINSFNPSYAVLKPENPMVPIMVQPEQQWPLHPEMNRSESGMEDMESENNMEQNQEDDEDDGEEEQEGDEDDEDDGGGYEIVTNKTSSMGTAE